MSSSKNVVDTKVKKSKSLKKQNSVEFTDKLNELNEQEEVYDISAPCEPIIDSLNGIIFTDDVEQKVLVKQKKNLRIMTYNVHGFKTKKFRKTLDQISKIIGMIDPDILVLEEVYIYKPNEACTSQQLRLLLKQYKLRYGVFSKSGINAVFSKFMFDCFEIDLGKDPVMNIPRNALVCSFPMNELIVVGTHLDVFDESGSFRKLQIEKIINQLRSDDPENFENKRIIITGDFNSLKRSDYTDKEWDQIVQIDHKRKVDTIVDVVPILEELGFQDSFDQCDTNIKVSVWSNRRVDYIFGKNIKFSQTSEHRVTASDHYPVYADISL